MNSVVGVHACLDIGDRRGRRQIMRLGMLFMLAGGTLQTSAWVISQLVLGRVISSI